MATRNAYLAYKEDTSHLIYWIIKTSNSIIQSTAQDSDVKLNTTGEVTVAGLVALSRLIAEHVKNIPPTVLRLFRSVIDARAAVHSIFQKIAAAYPDPKILKSNATHKYFIDALTEAFHNLGGGIFRRRVMAPLTSPTTRILPPKKSSTS